MKTRIIYFIILIALVAVETVIGITQHGNFIRDNLGDAIVVWAVYCLVQCFLGGKNNHHAVNAGVFVFSVIVEFLQKIHIVDILGIENKLMRTLIGTSFSYKDIICYAAGCAVASAGICIYDKMKKTVNNIQ